MQGLRTQESKKFNRFWQLVQDAAAKKGCVFFGENGEGDDFETDTMEGESFCGWLIPEKDTVAFEPAWAKGNVPEQWLEHMAWVSWEVSGENVTVAFEGYE